ncbi:hypothetical protein ACH427_27555 [Streptomyces sp. NPDC020379]|uniref:hypothetical protein n=1 Tax=Streptomyces sp. NPDC020379 TaxID=3365071 RepID=UPI00378CE333
MSGRRAPEDLPRPHPRRNLQEGWWRLFRIAAPAGKSFADPDETDHPRDTG